MANVLVFGDSIAYGAWDLQGGWIKRLREFLEEKNSDDLTECPLVYNLGISGDTSTGLLERFESEIKPRVEEGEETIIIIAIGQNDAQFLHDENRLRTSKEEFRQNLQKLISLAKRFSDRIVFVGLVPVDENRVAPIPWDMNKFYLNKNIREYNSAIKEVCEQKGAKFIDIFEEFVKTDYKRLLYEGLHPNSAGHKKIFELVKKELVKNGFI